jgi:hypothetical protein
MSKLDPVVAVHEAGHAVARYMTAEDFGINAKDAISYIEVGGGGVSRISADKRMGLKLQATTYGRVLTREMQDIFDRETVNIPRDALTEQHIVNTLRVARQNGVDVDRWLRSRMLIAVFGPAAEAKHTGCPFEEVLHSYECEDDLSGAVKDALWAGLESTEQIQELIAEAVVRASALIDSPEVQRAITSLANALPPVGKMPGKKAARIIRLAFGSSLPNLWNAE